MKATSDGPPVAPDSDGAAQLPQALLVYADTNNLGDEIQSLAVKRLLPQVDSCIDRDSLFTYAPPDGLVRRIVLNGWYSGAPENWPPSAYLHPLITSLHISWSPAYRSGLRALDVMLHESVVDYLRHYGPIGARDSSTVRLLKKAHVDCYFSGCVTLTFPRSTQPRDPDLLVLNDLPPAVVAAIRARSKKRIVETSHVGFAESAVQKRLQRAASLLEIYRTAGSVVTARLHCALPSVAMGTPTLLLDVAWDQYRFEGLHDLVHHCPVDTFLAGNSPFDPDNPLPTLDRHLDLAKALEERITTFCRPLRQAAPEYPLSDARLLAAARHVQGLLLGKIDRDRGRHERVTVASAKLREVLGALGELDRVESLTDAQRAALVAIGRAAADLDRIIVAGG